MATITPNGSVENAADHAAAAVHSLAHMAGPAYKDPTVATVASAARIVARVAEHGIAEVEQAVAPFGPHDYVIDTPVIELPAQARDTLTEMMNADTNVTIRHAGGTGQFRVVAIAQDHAKVRQLRDGRGPLPTRTLHYETIDEAGVGHVDTTADLTPTTVHGHLEYRDEDRQLAQDMSSALGNLEHVARAADGHGFVSRGSLRAITSAAGAIRCALHDMREAAKPAAPAFAVGDRVRCAGDTSMSNHDGTGTVTDVRSGYVDVILDGDENPYIYQPDQLTWIVPTPIPVLPF